MLSLTKSSTVVALVVVVAGCMAGPNVRSLAPATSPRGTEAAVIVDVAGEAVLHTGELVAVRAADFLVLLPPGLARMPFRTVRSASFSDVLGPRQITDGGTDSERRSLARFSRYPFGLSDAQLSDLLEALGQSELIEVGR